MEISFTVYGEPITKKAPRAFYNKRLGRIMVFSDKSTRAWEQAIAHQALEHRPGKLLDGPLSVAAVFYLQKPKSKPKRCLYPATRPDHDNLEKALYDALQGIIFTNDSRIVRKTFEKRWGDPPRVEVTIKEL